MAFVVALLALVVAVLAYQAASGGQALDAILGGLEAAVREVRQEAADTVLRLARALRGIPEEPGTPAGR